MKKYWAYSAGSGFIILFAVLVARASGSSPVVEVRVAHPPVVNAKFVNVPMVVMVEGWPDEKK